MKYKMNNGTMVEVYYKGNFKITVYETIDGWASMKKEEVKK